MHRFETVDQIIDKPEQAGLQAVDRDGDVLAKERLDAEMSKNPLGATRQPGNNANPAFVSPDVITSYRPNARLPGRPNSALPC